MVDTTRGSVRIRSWPKPRPGPRHPTNEFWTKWLRAYTYLYRYQPASVQAELQRATKGTVWMPRDIFISAARGRAWLLQDPEGRKYYPMAYIRDVSESLDAIGQLPGMMLYRAGDLWAAVSAGNPGQLLSSQGPDAAPEWVDVSGGNNYHVVRVAGGTQSSLLPQPNSTSYQLRSYLRFAWDWDEFDPDEFRIVTYGNSSQGGQTVTFQLAVVGALTSPIHTGGNDLAVTATPQVHDSGYLSVDNHKTGMQQMVLAVKGSNGTVLSINDYLEVHLRKT